MLEPQHKETIRFLEDSIKSQAFGTLTLTVIVKNGVPIPTSIKVVKMKRKKYKASSLDR